MLPWAVWCHWPRTLRMRKLRLRDVTGSQGYMDRIWNSLSLPVQVQILWVFFCVSLPFTSSQYGLGPVLSPLCLSFLFYKVSGYVGQMLSLFFNATLRILSSPDTCFSGYVHFPGPPCCPTVFPSRSGHPV